VDAAFRLAGAVEKRFAAGRAAVENLTQSIPAKAFREELVPQDPADEPAAEALQLVKLAIVSWRGPGFAGKLEERGPVRYSAAS